MINIKECFRLLMLESQISLKMLQLIRRAGRVFKICQSGFPLLAYRLRQPCKGYQFGLTNDDEDEKQILQKLSQDLSED